ncbi:MAG: MlaE family ABC transporter permease [Elusimicrobiota bacterium]
MNFSNKILNKFLSAAENFGGAALMVKKIFFFIFKPWDNPKNVVKQMVRIGVDSLPLVLLAALFTGMVLALQSGIASQKLFDMPVFMGLLVSFSIVLELGPVLTGLVIAGRIGASIAAQLGTMKVSDQLDALYTLGTTPEQYLGVPLFIAIMVMLPVITLMADLTGIWGGYIVATKTFNISGSVYMNDILSHLQIIHFVHGLIKSVFFGFIIVTVSCYMGFNTSGGAEGVGKSTTQAVVYSMLFILVSDYFLSQLLNTLGII